MLLFSFVSDFKIFTAFMVNLNVKAKFHEKLSVKSSYRSSRPEVFCKKGVLRNFAKSTGVFL